MLPKTISCIVRENEGLDDVRRAIQLASTNGLHLAISVVGIALPPPSAIAYAAPLDAWVEEKDQLQSDINAQAGRIEILLQESGVSGDISRHYVVSGGVATLAGMRARYADLALVFAATEANHPLREGVLRGLMFEGGIPFLVIPSDTTPSLRPERVVVAWNGTLEAARAVHGALDMIATAQAVSLAIVDPQETEWTNGEEPGFDIAAYLARHDIRVDVHRLSSGGKDVSNVLLRHVRDCDADLLVTGAYGHSRLREYIFGGTTLDLLERATVPVLMMH